MRTLMIPIMKLSHAGVQQAAPSHTMFQPFRHGCVPFHMNAELLRRQAMPGSGYVFGSVQREAAHFHLTSYNAILASAISVRLDTKMSIVNTHGRPSFLGQTIQKSHLLIFAAIRKIAQNGQLNPVSCDT